MNVRSPQPASPHVTFHEQQPLPTPLPGGAPHHGTPVRTVVYIHGIGRQPSGDILKSQWDKALFGCDIGERSRMAYWMNRDYYPANSNEAFTFVDQVAFPSECSPLRATLAEAVTDEAELVDLEAFADRLATRPEQRQVLRSIARRLESHSGSSNRSADAATQARDGNALPGQEVLPLPGPLGRLVTRQLTRLLLRDVNDFLYHSDRRQHMEDCLRERLLTGGPFVVVAHSQGSLIAYDLLRQMNHLDVQLLVTIGSPLGIDEVQEELRRWAGVDKLRIPECVRRWVNIADRLDPVAADPWLNESFFGTIAIEDQVQWSLNEDSPRHPHSGTGYLRSEPVHKVVQQTVGPGFGQVISEFQLARDLVRDLESLPRENRHPVLIQLADPDGNATTDQRRQAVIQSLQNDGENSPERELDVLKRFVAARLTRQEIGLLQEKFDRLTISRIWRDSTKKALIYRSGQTIQTRPAVTSYGATGRGICWGVLDTGVSQNHPHFQQFDNVRSQWDCTQTGPPVPKATDGNGHGTHVAAIIAGGMPELVQYDPSLPKEHFAGMAPEAKLQIYKVLNDRGDGSDSAIIKALDHIAELNEQAGQLVIQGINLSLGGNFDPDIYGCGHSPLCQELRRLWRQGVLICMAAGNEGYQALETEHGAIQANMDLSIGDPANLDEAIAVGSVHRDNPYVYGVSYFSSRGPTADGRRKPDLVAPGERIWSACHRFQNGAAPSPLYVAMSGTSMAAPHVSGLLAAFLSQRREFIGYPERVKQILLQNCTDLGRDPYTQGQGLPNLIRMLAAT